MSKAIPLNAAGSISRPQKLADANGNPLPPEPISEAAKAKQIKAQDAVPVLKFRYLKNRLISLRDIPIPVIPSKPVEKYTTHGVSLVHDFDLSKVHTIRLRDEMPHERKHLSGMSDTMISKLKAQAEDVAVANRLYNDMIRYEISNYVENGTLEIVDDPFEGREVTESDYEASVALHRAQPANK